MPLDNTSISAISKGAVILIIVILVFSLILIFRTSKFKENVQDIRSGRRYALGASWTAGRKRAATAKIKATCRNKCIPVVKSYGYKPTSAAYRQKLTKCITACVQDEQSFLNNITNQFSNISLNLN